MINTDATQTKKMCKLFSVNRSVPLIYQSLDFLFLLSAFNPSI